MPTQEQIDALREYGRKKIIAIPLIGKRPFFKKWTELTHTPHDLIVFDRRNIGLLTGRVSNITVLDIDIQDGGMAHWNKIKKMFPEIHTPIASTPSKGLHLYFKYNPRLASTSKLKLNGNTIGWDVLNDGRQVVAPPSHAYKWKQGMDIPFAKMPMWLEQYIILLKST